MFSLYSIDLLIFPILDGALALTKISHTDQKLQHMTDRVGIKVMPHPVVAMATALSLYPQERGQPRMMTEELITKRLHTKHSLAKKLVPAITQRLNIALHHRRSLTLGRKALR